MNKLIIEDLMNRLKRKTKDLSQELGKHKEELDILKFEDWLPVMIMDMPTVQFEHQFDPMDWAPGLFAGSEGMKFKIIKVDLENRKITLEQDYDKKT